MDVSKYIGLPFKPLGRDFDGCDCWGLVRLIYNRELDIELPSLTYADKFDPIELNALLTSEEKHWTSIELGKERPGDVLALRSINPHVGMIIDNTRMIHIQATTRACIDRYKRIAWAKRIMGIYRHAALT